jgi:tRNA pseudouridine38-40 synthase
MRNIRLTVAFDGTAYHGWQVQPGRPTIQGLLGEALRKIIGESPTLTGSGRTDAGAHARGLVANFHTSSTIPPDALARALNSRLPEDVRVLRVSRAHDTFHARRSAISKEYRYQIYRGEVLPPSLVREYYHYPYPLDLEKMRAGAGRFVGEHDFASFAARSGGAKRESRRGTVRKVFRCALRERGSRLYFTVEGDGFLHHMVRNMIGTLLELGRGRMIFEDFEQLFRCQDRTQAGFTAPARGLVLIRVRYGRRKSA